MPNYPTQFNQIRAKDRKKDKTRQKKSISSPVSEITDVEWVIMIILAIIADLSILTGLICMPILLLWYIIRLQGVPFPIWKTIITGGSEIISVGILPGCTGFIVWTFLEQKGYLGKITKLTKLIRK